MIGSIDRPFMVLNLTDVTAVNVTVLIPECLNSIPLKTKYLGGSH